jgi:acyl carrier protein
MDVNVPRDATDFDAKDESSQSSPTPQRAIRKPTLRAELERSHAASRNGVAIRYVQQLVKTIAESEETPAAETRFLDAGLDSLMIVEMSSQIQAEFGTEQEIPATLVFDYPRICDLSNFLVQELLPDESETSRSSSTESVSPQQATSSSNEPSKLENEIASLSEEQALAELMKELEA